MIKDELRLTSVKIHQEIFDSFQIEAIRNKFNMQRLVNRALDLYAKDEEFRRKIHNHIDLLHKGNL